MYRVRPATPSDLDLLTRFTHEEAREAEGRALDRETVRRGVREGLDGRARYWVLETGAGEPVGSASAVREWSDWKASHYWWVQSMYIDPGHRGRGLAGRLLEEIAREARLDGAPDLRLYVHGGNQAARAAYRRGGFEESPYRIMIRRLG